MEAPPRFRDGGIMPRFRQETAGPDGWSREIYPNMSGYRMGCCDCSLVHDVQFTVVEVTAIREDGTFDCEELDPERYRVMMRVRRNKRSTGQMRRKR